MNSHLPRAIVSSVPDDWSITDLEFLDWSATTILEPFLLADGSGPAIQQTVVRLGYNRQALFVRFDCQDHDIWGTFKERDDPIYDEEVVEVFLSPGDTAPIDYYEFEVSPNGVLLDLTAHNPMGDRTHLKVDFGWNCDGLRWQAGRDDERHHWWAVLAIPWASIGAYYGRPAAWRANFYRIERPGNAPPEFSCWSPTMVIPPDYHRPAYFGVLEIGAPS